MTIATQPNVTRRAVVLSTSQSLLNQLETFGLAITTRLLHRLPGAEAPLIPAGAGLLLLPAGADGPHLMLILTAGDDAADQTSDFYSNTPVLTLPQDVDQLSAALNTKPGQAA